MNASATRPGDTGVDAEGLIEALAAEPDLGEVQAVIAAVVWPDAAAPTEQDVEAVTAPAVQEDPEAWNAYLRASGAAWNGEAESWPAFVEWFVYYADEQGLGASARTFCDYATANGPSQVFAEYGVVLAVADEGGSPPLTAGQAVVEYGPELIAGFRRQHPELAETTDDELRAMMAELLAGQTA